MSVYYKNLQAEYVVRQSQRVDPNEEYLIPSNVVPDWANDSQVLDDVINQNAQIGDGTQYFVSVVDALDHLRGIGRVEIMSVSDNIMIPTQEKGFPDYAGYNVFKKGYRFSAVANTETSHQVCYPGTMLLQGLGLRIGDTATDGDHITVEIVDKDGLYYPAGSVLAQFADEFYMWPGRYFCATCPDAKTIYPGLYIKVTYHAMGEFNVIILVEHHLRSVSL